MAVVAPTALSAAEMARLVRQRDLSPVDIVDAHLARIEALNPRLNAYIAVDDEGARAAARQAEAAVRREDPLGPLHGVPLSMKSTVEVTGMPWDVGSRSRAGIRGGTDAVVVRRAKAAGAIILGVTNVAEQLMAWESDNALYGRTSSPWDLGTDARRIERRRGGGDCRRIVGRRRRERRRRVDPRPGALQRDLRAEADARPRPGDGPLPARAAVLFADRRHRADGAHD